MTDTAPAPIARPGDLAIIDEADYEKPGSYFWLAEVTAVDADGRVTEVANTNGVEVPAGGLRRLHVMSATDVDVPAAMDIERTRIELRDQWVSLAEIRDRLAPARIR